MADSSFDIVSRFDFQEVRNAVQQASKEVATRYDLKNAGASLEIEGESLVVEASDDYTLTQVIDVLQSKLVRRGIDLKTLRYGKIEPASGARARQSITLQDGIPIDTAKKIVAEIKKMKTKVQASIQGDTVRVSGKKLDDLQSVMAVLKGLDLDVPLTFTNYR